MTEPGDKNELRDIVPSPGGSLAKRESTLVRRGLEDVSKLADSQWWLIECERPLVLLVDCGSPIEETIEQILSTNGYEVRSCSNLEVMELVRKLHPHVTIMRDIFSVEELSKCSEIVFCAATEEEEFPWDSTPILRSQLDENEVLHVMSSCVCKNQKQRREFSRAFSHDTNVLDFLMAVTSVVATEIAQCERHGYNVTVIGVRVDENWQELRGDFLLRGIRNLPNSLNEKMESLCGPNILFRDERTAWENFFTILLPQTSGHVVSEFADRVHSLIEGTDWQHLIGGSVKLTAAISVAAFPQDGTSAIELLERIWFGS